MGILINQYPAERAMPVAKIVVIISFLEPDDPVDIGAVLAYLRTILENRTNHLREA